MRASMYFFYGKIFFCLCLTIPLSAQVATTQLNMEGDIYAWYDQAIGKDKTGLLVGQYHALQRVTRTSHQFFQSDVWSLGALHFRGQQYDSVDLLYDLEKGVMLIRHPFNFALHNQPIKLTQNQVSWFYMFGHKFKYYDQRIMIYEPGFYDMLFEGDQLNLMCRRMKNVEADRTLEYVATNKYLMEYEGNFYRVKGKSSFTKVFKQHKAEIKSFANSNKLNLKTDDSGEYDLQRMADFCNKLLTTKAQ